MRLPYPSIESIKFEFIAGTYLAERNFSIPFVPAKKFFNLKMLGVNETKTITKQYFN